MGTGVPSCVWVDEMAACTHFVSQGREGARSGEAWCTVCGAQTLAVHDRPCGECRHYKADSSAMNDRVGICTRHLMRVPRDMRVTYTVATNNSPLCFEAAL